MTSWTNPPRRDVRTLPPDARRPATSTTAGILRPDEHARRVQLARLPVAPALEPWIENYWTVRWELAAGEVFGSQVVPHPAVHLSVESGTTPHHGFAMPVVLVHGVPTRRFDFELAGAGRVFGVKFRPGGFAAFTGEEARSWTGRVRAADALLGSDASRLLHDVLACEDDADRAAVVDDVLGQRTSAPDPAYERLLEIVTGMLADASLTSVDAVAQRFGCSERTLQRLFRRYVGVSPKWVLRRYRLHDAIAILDTGDYDDLADLAARLGFYDQAHFTREFTAQVGRSPAAYLSLRPAT